MRTYSAMCAGPAQELALLCMHSVRMADTACVCCNYTLHCITLHSDPNALNNDGCTPLFFACEMCHTGVVQWLVREGGQ
jgi:Ankyrin repeats (many copies)